MHKAALLEPHCHGCGSQPASRLHTALLGKVCSKLGMCFTGACSAQAQPGHSIPEQTWTQRQEGEGSADGENTHRVIPGSCCSWQGGFAAQGSSAKSYSGSRAPFAPHVPDTGDRELDHNNSHVIPRAPPALTLAGKAHWEQGWTITAASLMDFSSSISRSRCCICSGPPESNSSAPKPGLNAAVPTQTLQGSSSWPDTILPGDTARGTARGSDSPAEPVPEPQEPSCP